MRTHEEALSALRKKEKVLKIDGAKVQKGRWKYLDGSPLIFVSSTELEAEKTELQDAEIRVKQLKEKETILPQQLEATKRSLQLQMQAIEKLSAEVAEVEKAQRLKTEELAKGSAFYSERLGLRFERFEDRGKLILTSFWKSNWYISSRESFAIHFSEDR